MERPSGLVSEMVTFAEEAGTDMITYLPSKSDYIRSYFSRMGT